MFARIADFADTAWYRLKRNPVLVGSAALWAVEFVQTQDAITWQGALTVLVGFLSRSQTVPAKEFKALQGATDKLVDAILEDMDAAIEAGLPDEPEV